MTAVRRQRNGLISGVALLAGLCLLVGLALGIVSLACFDRDFYTSEYDKLGTAACIGISREDLMTATHVLLDYTCGTRDDLLVTAEINGEARAVFNQREMDHMVDVRTLYLGTMTVRNVCLVTAAALLALLFGLGKRPRAVLRGYVASNAVFVGVFAVLAAYAAVDFNSFWTGFHHVFFANDLWLLDPATSVLIQMVPSQFFSDLIFRIVAMFLAAALALLAGALIWNHFLKRKQAAA